MKRLNTEALAALVGQHKVQLRAFPTDLVAAARGIGRDVLGELAGRGAGARKVHDSYVAFRTRVGAWSDISLKAVLEAREG
jgi:TRAP-type mannitol/chloroaromatic compound transport system substrate-binding protein